jgi:cytochrome c553
MKFSTFVALAALSAATPVWSAGGDAAAGQTKAAVCAACHSVDGNSVDPQYPKIAGQHADYIAQQLALFKSGKRMNPIMLGITATLTEQDMADLAAYFATQKAKPDLADEALVPVGQALYQSGDAKRGIPACMACHGPTGHGNPASRYPSIGSQHAQYTADLLRRFRGGAVYGDENDANAKIMSQVAATLTDAEIEALASYLQGLSPATP